MGFLSKITSLGKGLAKSALKNVGGALAGRAGQALGNKVNAVSSSFLARTSGILPAPGQALGQAQLSKLPGAKAFQAVRKTPYGTNKFASPIPTLPKFGP